MKNSLSKMMLLGSMVIFGTVGVFRRFIPLSSAAIAMLRGGIGMISLLLIMLLLRKKISFSSIRQNLPYLLISGVCLGVNWILLFEAYNYTSVAVATVCYYMAPILVLAVAPFLLRERLTGRKVFCILTALVGLVLVSGLLSGNETAGDLRGILFGLGAAVFYASVMLLNQKIRNISAYDKTVVQLGTSTAVLLPYVLFTGFGADGALSGFAVLMICVVGIVHTGLAYALYFGSMEALPAQTVALFSYADPALAILISAFVLSEPINGWEILGIVLILGATLFSEFPKKKGSE